MSTGGGSGGGFEVLEALVPLRVTEFDDAEANMRAGLSELERLGQANPVTVPFNIEVPPEASEEIRAAIEELNTLAQDGFSDAEIRAFVEGLESVGGSLEDLLPLFAQGFTIANLGETIEGSRELISELRTASQAAKEFGNGFTLENLPPTISGVDDLIQKLTEANELANEFGKDFTLENLPQAISGADDLIKELQDVNDQTQTFGAGFTLENLPQTVQGARDFVEQLRSGEAEVRKLLQGLDLIPQTFEDFEVDLDFEFPEVPTDQIEDFVNELREGSNQTSKLQSGFRGLIVAATGVAGTALSLGVAIQQTNSFLREQAEVQEGLKELQDVRIEQELRLAQIQEDRLDNLREEGNQQIAEDGTTAVLQDLEVQQEALIAANSKLQQTLQRLGAEVTAAEQARQEFIDGNASGFETPFLGDTGSNFAASLTTVSDTFVTSDIDEARESFAKVQEQVKSLNETFAQNQALIDELAAAQDALAEKEFEANAERRAQVDGELADLDQKIAAIEGNTEEVDRLAEAEARAADIAAGRTPLQVEELANKREALRLAQDEAEQLRINTRLENEALAIQARAAEAAGDDAEAERINDILERRADIEAGYSETQATRLALLRDEAELNEEITDQRKELLDLEEDLRKQQEETNDLRNELAEQNEQLQEDGNVSSDAFDSSSGFDRAGGIISGEVDFQIDKRIEIQEDIRETNKEIAMSLAEENNLSTSISALAEALKNNENESALTGVISDLTAVLETLGIG